MLTSIALYAVTQTTVINLEVPSTRLYNLEAVLSKTLGEEVHIGTPLLNDILAISVKDVPVAEFKKRVAKVMNATWTQKRGFVLLEQTLEQRNQEQQFRDVEAMKKAIASIEKSKVSAAKLAEFNESEAKKLKKDLEQLSKTVIQDDGNSGNTFSVNNSFWTRQNQIEARGPYNRFCHRLTARLTPAMIAGLTDTSPSRVYSSNPTQLQLRLPIKYEDLLSQLVQEQQVWADEIKGVPIEGPLAQGGGRYSLGSLADQVEPMSERGVTVHVKFTRESYSDGVMGEIKLYNKDGVSVAQSNVSFGGWDEETFAELNAERVEAKKIEVVFSPMGKIYRDWVKSAERTPNKTAKNETLIARLLNPEKNEANGEYVLDILNHFAKGRNVIAHNIKDLSPDVPLTSKYMKSVTDIEDEKDWLTVAQLQRFKTRESLLDPKLLGPMVRKAQNSDCNTIEEEADFALKLPPTGQAEWEYRRFINAVRPYELPVYNDKWALRIWANLPPALRAKLSSGSPIKLSELDQRIQQDVYRSIFWQSYSNWNVDYESFRSKDGEWDESFNKIQNQIYGGLLQEPTNMCPMGLTGDMVITGTQTNGDTLLIGADPTADYVQSRAMPPNQVGQNLFMQKYPKKYPWISNSWNKHDYSNIRLIKQRTISFSLTVRKGIKKSYYLSEMHVTDPKVYTSENLPAEILKKIKEGYAEAEKNDKHYGENPYGNGGVTVPPPPTQLLQR